MSLLLLLVGLIIAVSVVAGAMKMPGNAIKGAAAIAAVVIMVVFAALSSIRYVGENEVGVIVKNFGRNLPSGQIIATNGEKGPQAKILGPGWHFWYFPGLFNIDMVAVVDIGTDEVGLLKTEDGFALPEGEAFAPEWSTDQFQQMLDAEYFLTAGKGHKGPQASVLRPGKYRLNTKLYAVETVPATNIEKATVGVVKSNVGKSPVGADSGAEIVEVGQRGIWREPFTPQKLYLNTKAYEITIISTKERTVRYGSGGQNDDSEIEVRTSDGFTFPVDVRIEYQITPTDAPTVVARFGGEEEQLRSRLASTVRDIFRNNAESVKALDYVQQRSTQGQTSTTTLRERMQPLGVTIKAVAIGDIGDEASLGDLLKTQKDREIALQEQITFQEQQKAAEQRKELTRTEQEAEEERRLATAKYEVDIAGQAKEQRIIEAGAEAEAIRIKAEAQAEAYRVIAEQIGSGNAALVELLKIVGESGINITPKVMVVGNSDGGNGGGQSAETTALIGTMLDSMVERAEGEPGLNNK